MYQLISELVSERKAEVVRHVNQTLVQLYFEVGRIIVEHLQDGAERAGYGKDVLKRLAKRLSENLGSGFSVANLTNMRLFYLVYSKSETLSPISQLPDFQLSWSHYLKLSRVDDPQERRFYEIEATQNNWSLRELRRQMDSALYQRLALSRDKEGVRQLAE